MSSVLKITRQILECEDRVNEIWFTRKKRSTIHEDRLREKIRNIHLIEESLFYRLWEMEDDWEEVDSFSLGDFPERVIYCNSEFHIALEQDKYLLYGVKCDC